MGFGNFLRQTANGVSKGIDWINKNPAGQQVGNLLKQIPGVGAAWTLAKPVVGMAKKTWDAAEPGIKLAQEAYKNKRFSSDDADRLYSTAKNTYNQGRDTYLAGSSALANYKRPRFV